MQLSLLVMTHALQWHVSVICTIYSTVCVRREENLLIMSFLIEFYYCFLVIDVFFRLIVQTESSFLSLKL